MGSKVAIETLKLGLKISNIWGSQTVHEPLAWWDPENLRKEGIVSPTL